MSREEIAITTSVLALIFSMISWYWGWKKSMSVQNRILLNSLKNEARKEIVNCIKQYIEWASDLNPKIRSLADPNKNIANSAGIAIHQLRLDQRSYQWIRSLEEYESLFSETKHVRVDILSKIRSVEEDVNSLLDDGACQDDGIDNYLEYTDIAASKLMDLLGLAYDMQVYIQNKSLGEISGHKVAPRLPQNRKTALMIEQNGTLKVIGNDNFKKSVGDAIRQRDLL